MSGIDRRTFLKGAAAGTAGMWIATSAGIRWASAAEASWTPYQEDPEQFPQGVASGDPLADAVMIWTRVEGTPAQVRWEVSEDPTFFPPSVAASGTEPQGGDGTVKVDVTGLEPGRTYYYRFHAAGATSRVGRTKTAPADSASALGFAVVSCQNFTAGYYAAWRHIANRANRPDDIDFVLHVGDYIYEGGGADLRAHTPDREIIEVEEYRTRYKQYRSDADLRAAHAAHPFIVTMDDHEVTNNSYRDGAQNHQEDEGDYFVRRANAFQVYDEYMPIRLPEGRDGADMRIYRSLDFGGLLGLFVLDTRQYRAEQANDSLFPVPGPQTDGRIDDPARPYLGQNQKEWLEGELTDSSATWKVLGNQAMLAQFTYGAWPDEVGRAMQDLIGMPPDGYTVNPDQWDGYQKEQKAFLEFLAGIDNVVVCTGDIHMSFANELYADEGRFRLEDPVGVEFIGPSISSSNFNESIGVPPRTTSIAIEQSIKAGNPHIRYTEVDSNGYVVVRLNQGEAVGEWWHLSGLPGMSAVRDPNADEELATAWRVREGTSTLDWVGGAPVATV